MEKGYTLVILDLTKRNQRFIFGGAMYFNKWYWKLIPILKAQILLFSNRAEIMLTLVYFMWYVTGKKTPIHLISSSDKPGLDLLKVEYIKVYIKLFIFKALLYIIKS